jgi:subtilase family serine protease
MKTKTHPFNPETEMTNIDNNLKRRTRWIAAAMLLAGFISVTTFSATAADMKTLHGHVPAIVSELKAQGDLPAETNLSLAIGLPLHHTDELNNLLKQVYDPNSPNYHHFLTPEQFTEKFGPTKEDYQMVENFARVNGLNIKATHSNRMLLDVTGKVSDIEKAFNVKLRVYQHPNGKRQFFAPDTEPSVSSALPISRRFRFGQLPRAASAFKN